MSVKSAYDKRAKYYTKDTDTIFLFEMEKNIVMEFLDLKKDTKILDLGCGVGRYIPLITKKTKRLTSSDLSEEMLDIIKAKYPMIQCIQSDMTKKLPFKNGTFDKVLCTQAIKHVKDIWKTFKEISRILQTKWEFIFTVIHPEANRQWYQLKKPNTINIDEPCYLTRQTLTQLLDAIEIAKFSLIWMKQAIVWEEVKWLLTKASYNKMKNKALILIFRVKKT